MEKDNRDPFDSVSAQFMVCAEFIGSQVSRNWTLVSTLYEDRGYSGSHLRRFGFQSLLADIKRGLIDVVVVHRLDRLTRNLSELSANPCRVQGARCCLGFGDSAIAPCFRRWVASCGSVSNQYPDFFCGVRAGNCRRRRCLWPATVAGGQFEWLGLELSAPMSGRSFLAA